MGRGYTTLVTFSFRSFVAAPACFWVSSSTPSLNVPSHFRGCRNQLLPIPSPPPHSPSHLPLLPSLLSSLPQLRDRLSLSELGNGIRRNKGERHMGQVEGCSQRVLKQQPLIRLSPPQTPASPLSVASLRSCFQALPTPFCPPNIRLSAQ